MKIDKKPFLISRKCRGKRNKFYINTLTISKPTEKARDRKEAGKSRRTASFLFFLPVNDFKARVCQTMFLNSLSITEKAFRSWKIKERHGEDEAQMMIKA